MKNISTDIENVTISSKNVSSNAGEVEEAVKVMTEKATATSKLIQSTAEKSKNSLENTEEMARTINELNQNVQVMAKTASSVSDQMTIANDGLSKSTNDVQAISDSFVELTDLVRSNDQSANDMNVTTESVSKEIIGVKDISVITETNAKEITEVASKLLGVNSNLEDYIATFKLPKTVPGDDLLVIKNYVTGSLKHSWENICKQSGVQEKAITTEDVYFEAEVNKIIDITAKVSKLTREKLLKGLHQYEEEERNAA